jgi:hypothetical protein
MAMPKNEEQAAEDGQVLQRHPPAVALEQRGVLLEADELVVRQQPRGGQRQ